MTKPAPVPKPVKAAKKAAAATPPQAWPANPTVHPRIQAAFDLHKITAREEERRARADAKVAKAKAALNIVEHDGHTYYKPIADKAVEAHFAIQRSAKFLPAIPGLFDLIAAANRGAALQGRALCSRHDVAPLVHVFLGHTRGEWDYHSQPMDYAIGAHGDRDRMLSESAAQIAVITGEYGIDWAKFQGTQWREIRSALMGATWFCLGAPHCTGDRPGVVCMDVALFCGLGVAVPGVSLLNGSQWDGVPVAISELARHDAAVRTFVELVSLAGTSLPLSDNLVALTVALAGPKRWSRLASHQRVVWADLNGRASLARVINESAFETPRARDLSTWEALVSWVRSTVGADERSDVFRTLLGGTAGFEPPVKKTELDLINERLAKAESAGNRMKDNGSFADPNVEVVTVGGLLRDSQTPRIVAVLDGMSAR